MAGDLVVNALADAYNDHANFKFESAISKYLHVLKLDPKNTGAINNLSVLYLNMSRVFEAEKCIVDFLRENEGDATTFNHLAVAFQRSARTAESLALLEHARSLDPYKIETYLNMTTAYGLLGDNIRAMECSLEAIKIDPSSSPAFNNLGTILNNMAKFEEAQIAFQTAAELNPKNIEAFVNLGSSFSRDGNTKEAIKTFEKALRRLPKSGVTQADVILFLLSFEYLKEGRLREGWKYYDSGFHPNIPSSSARAVARTFTKPRWKGQKIKNETLLVWREQGLGDELMFLSCIPDLLKIVDNVIIECDYRLVDTLQRSFPTVKVRSQYYGPAPSYSAIYNDYDYHLPLGSLMRYVRPTIESFKNSGPYLEIDQQKVAKFSERLASYKDKLLIGVCWRSGNIDALRALTYVGIMKWGEIFSIEDVVWVNLQYGECEEECLAAEKEFGIKIVRWPDLDLKDDLDDVFALMSVLDYVVTVATAVHHMAAATGCETLLITPKGAWNRFHLNYDPWFSNLHPFVVDYQKLDEAFPLVRDYILSNRNRGSNSTVTSVEV
jgi:tetratricopeptide (TPR) repeat protein